LRNSKIIATIGVLTSFVVGMWGQYLMPNPPFSIWAAENAFLAGKHKNAGIDCEGCHKEGQPKRYVPTSLCLQCHGDHSKLVEKTEKLSANPHDSHLGEIDCNKCHNAHKQSEDYCGSCHNFGFKVP
jgi:hypothetical protein